MDKLLNGIGVLSGLFIISTILYLYIAACLSIIKIKDLLKQVIKKEGGE